MAIYIYETVDEPHSQFEVRQSMNDPALTAHPESGKPVRRVISGGYGIIQKGRSVPVPAPKRGGGCCGGACGCHH